MQWRHGDYLRGAGLPAPAPSGLLVGARRGYQTHLLSSQGVDPVAAAAAVLDGVQAAAAQLPEGSATVAMFLSTEDVMTLRKTGVRSVPVVLQTDAWIPVPVGGFPEWLAMQPRGRRGNVRRELRVR